MPFLPKIWGMQIVAPENSLAQVPARICHLASSAAPLFPLSSIPLEGRGEEERTFPADQNFDSTPPSLEPMKTFNPFLGLALALGLAHAASAQTTAFNYQGQLTDNGAPAVGIYDLSFSLRDSLTAGSPIGSPLSAPAVPVNNGQYTVTLDFGAGPFTGADRWLEISVRTTGSGGAYSILSPRQLITPTPYALQAMNAAAASSVAASNVSGTLNTAQIPSLDAAKINSGTVSDARLSTNVVLLNSSPYFSGTVTAGSFGGSGNGLSGLWKTAGNAGTVPGTEFIGTTDNLPLELKVNGIRALRLEPNASSPNVIAGHSGNYVVTGVAGATISGGGSSGNTNSVLGNYASIGGGFRNTIQSNGYNSAIGGGSFNTNTGFYATVPGGDQNVAGSNSFAAGHRAKANHAGSFVWADSINADFATTAANQFLIRAANGVGINSASTPEGGLVVNGPIHVNAFDLFLLSDLDHNHGLGWYGSSKNFASQAPDGPVLYGYGGGSLGTRQFGTEKIALSWNASQTVTVPGVITFATAAQIPLDINSSNTGGTWLNLVNNAASGHSWSLISSGNANGEGPGKLLFRDASQGVVMTLSTNGNVGIGTYNPTNKLMVGTARCDGSSWINASDRNLKQDFAPVNAQSILARVVNLPMQTWSYKAQPDQTHLGPVAQDFRAAFNLGADDVSIATVDEGGVALAAIQGLNEIVKEKEAKISALEKRLADLEKVVSNLALKK